jgi:hypothetical protein
VQLEWHLFLEILGERPPKFMYRPGNSDCDGMYEWQGYSRVAPPNVAMRWVIFNDMEERDVYTGASRKVPQNSMCIARTSN